MNLLNLPITTALGITTTAPMKLNASPRNIAVQANFTYGSGGTTVDAYLQTSLDSGNTWIDIAEFHFALASLRQVYNLNAQTPVSTAYTPTDGSLAASTAKDGILGPQYRVKYTSAGTYAATTLTVDVQGDLIPVFP
jgi:hypothetical protein